MEKSPAAVGSFRDEGRETRHKEGPRGGWLQAEIAEVVGVGNNYGVERMLGGLEVRKEGRVLSYVLLLRASELFTEDSGTGFTV